MKAPFYTTTTTLCNGEVELTDNILSLPGSIEENMSHYYLGYISDEQMPEYWHMGKIELIDGVITAKNIRQNYGWGYVWHWEPSDNGAIDIMCGSLIYSDGNSKRDTRTYTEHFVNKCTIANANAQNAFRVYFGIMPVRSQDITPDGTDVQPFYNGHYNTFMNRDVVLTAEQIRDFVNGDYTVTLSSLNFGQSYYSISFTGTDFDEETNTCKIAGFSTYDGEFTIYVQIIYCTAYGNSAYLAGNAQKYASRLSPFFAAKIEGDDNIPAQTVLLSPNNLHTKVYTLAQANFNALGTDIDSVQYLSGYLATVGSCSMGNYEWVNGLTADDFYQHYMINGTEHKATKWWYADSGILRDKYIIAGAQNYMFAQVVCPLPLSDLSKIIALSLNKIETAITSPGSVSSFTCSQTYTTNYSVAMYDVDTTDSLGIRKSENYAAISEELLNWQQPGNDVTVDEFKEEDIPEWVPPEPEDEDRSGGVDYTHNGSFTAGTATGFVTQYVLKADQIASLGSYLWAAFGSNDFIDSLLVAAGETFSFDTSKILEFIVSARQYPIGIQHLDSFDPVDDIIYIGRGLAGIDLNSGDQIGVLNSYCEGIKGGFCKIPIEDKWKDFRGYEPCSRVTVIVPFCGSLELAPSQAIDSTIYLDYAIDFSCGAVQACITIDNGRNKYIAGVLDGSIGANIELTASNLSQMLLKSMKSISTIVGAIALGAVGAEAAEASAMEGYASSMTSTGDQLVHSRFMESNTKNVLNFGSSISSIGNMSVSPSYHIGTASGFAAFQITEPIVRVEYRHYEVPPNYPHIYGYACNKTVTLGSLEGKGFTVCKNVDLTGVPATQDELAILEQLLQSGVYL